MSRKDWNGWMTPIEYCNGKVRYDKITAVTAKNARWEQSHIELRIYQCPECGGWHLTKQLRNNKYYGNMQTQFRKNRRRF